MSGVDGSSSLIGNFFRLGVGSRCVAITDTDYLQWHTEVVAIGVLGFIDKGSSIVDFFTALNRLMSDQTLFASESVEPINSLKLTRRQHDVLDLIHRGYVSKEIARKLGIAKGTVDNHVSALLDVLGANSRAHAVSIAVELGLLAADSLPARGQSKVSIDENNDTKEDAGIAAPLESMY